MKKFFIMFAVVLLLALQMKAQNGYSTYKWNDESQFEGYFVNGVINGTGIYYWSKGHYFVGNWTNGKINGYGVEVFPDNTYRLLYYENDKVVTNRVVGSKQTLDTGVGIYTGEMVNGKACGKGTFRWNSGQCFEGTWTADGKSRYGVLYKNGSREPWYVGTWTNEKFDGYGFVASNSGHFTVGLWQNDEYQCRSKLEFSSSDLHELRQQIEQSQAALPIKINDDIAISKIYIDGNYYIMQYDVYNYSMYKNVKGNYRQFRETLYTQMKTGTGSMEVYTTLVKNNMQMKQVYYYVPNRDKTEFIFSTEDLQNIIK